LEYNLTCLPAILDIMIFYTNVAARLVHAMVVRYVPGRAQAGGSGRIAA